MMKLDPMRAIVRNMTVDDLEQVGIIERDAFSTPWSAIGYVYEINHRSPTHLGVIELPDVRAYREPQMERLQVLRRHATSVSVGAVVAYGSMWIRNGESHISHIASHLKHRGQGMGELMLVGLLARAIACQAQFSALEVRVSNIVAQSLYIKYGYDRAAILPKYYTDNKEDAYLMKIPSLGSSYMPIFQANVKILAEKFNFKDAFSGLRLEQLVK